jgi:hypothetical protein
MLKLYLFPRTIIPLSSIRSSSVPLINRVSNDYIFYLPLPPALSSAPWNFSAFPGKFRDLMKQGSSYMSLALRSVQSEERAQLRSELSNKINGMSRSAYEEMENWLGDNRNPKNSQLNNWTKQHLQALLKKLQNNISANEQFLRSVHKSRADRQEISLIYLHADKILPITPQRALEHFVSVQESYHSPRFYFNIMLMPFTACLTVLPGPNVFFAWNFYRCLCHYQAVQGAKFLEKQLKNNKVAETELEVSDKDEIWRLMEVEESQIRDYIKRWVSR